MRATTYTTLSLLLVACLAAADARKVLSDGPDNTYVRDRTFVNIAQHKQPAKPTMPIKEVEKREPAGRFATGLSTGKHLLSDGPDNTYVRDRTFVNIAQHKQPAKPTMPIKEVEKREPAGRFATGLSTGKHLLSDGPDNTYVRDRTFVNIAQHKQPAKPTMPIKEVEKREPAGRFATGLSTGKHLLSDGPDNTYVRDRTFVNIAQHKQPAKPTMPIKEVEKREPAGRFATGLSTGH